MKPDTARQSAAALAILAAVCYGFSVPLSKGLLAVLPPVMLAALLYLGAGLGMAALRLFTVKRGGRFAEARMTRKDFPFAAAMIVLDIAAPVLLLLGLSEASPGSVALLSNFEIVATALIAMLFFHESVGRRMWWVIAIITAACFLLSVEDLSSFSLSAGSLYVLLACCCWGLENNCTRVLSVKDPMQIVVLKGFGAGLGALLTALLLGQTAAPPLPAALALLLGFAAYGLSIFFYIHAQRTLGAARTSAYYAFAPFIGVGLSALLYRAAADGNVSRRAGADGLRRMAGSAGKPFPPPYTPAGFTRTPPPPRRRPPQPSAPRNRSRRAQPCPPP